MRVKQLPSFYLHEKNKQKHTGGAISEPPACLNNKPIIITFIAMEIVSYALF